MNPSLLLATALYSLFVIYGSLVPLEFNHALPFETAVNQFENIRLFHIGTEHRADWIANILLYIPLAFGASASFGGIKNPLLRTLISASILTSGIGLAFAIEFTQLFFPPRTVSINDLAAESIGTFVGILGWQFSGAYFSNLYRHLLHSSLVSAQAAIIFYILFYCASCLFPFDFVTSMDELNTKLQNGHDTFFWNIGYCSADSLRCSVKLSVEILAFLPLGILFCYLPYVQSPMTVALMSGFFLGSFIESTQVFLLSGEGQGFSVLTRMMGMAAGVRLFLWVKQQSFDDMVPLLQRAALFVIPVYLLMALSINGLSPWITTEQALIKLNETHFLPLYYFYYTTEGLAFQSLLNNVGLYLPIGFLAWARCLKPYSEHKKPPHWFYIGLLAFLFAVIIETEKLFLANKHVDPSDVWLAFFAASGCYGLMNNLLNWIRDDKTSLESLIAQQFAPEKTPSIIHPDEPIKFSASVESVLPLSEISKNWRSVSFLLVGIITTALFNYPIGAIWLGLFLIAYAALLLYFPFSWLIALPALLPIMDFAPYTGRFFFDEFDLVILTTLAFYFWQKPKLPNRSLLSALTILLLAIFSLLYTVSLLIGLLPLQHIDANSFSSYYSNYNSLRVGKGMFFSLMLLPFLQQTVRRYRFAYTYFSYGILIGLAMVIGASCFERFLFPGLFNFSSNYRIIALFSSMHTGGGHIDVYLALTLPFIAILFLNSSPSWLKNALGIGLFITGLYVVLVTFSRGVYFSTVLEFFTIAILLWRFKANATKNWHTSLVFPLLFAIALFVSIPVFKGAFIQERFGQMNSDTNIRTNHWNDAIKMMDDDMVTDLFGMGIGSYPKTYLWRNSENVTPAIQKIDMENGNAYLKLSSGDPLYLGQYIDVKPNTTYRLSADLRSSKESPSLKIAICEKSLLYSLRCSGSDVTEKSQPNKWLHVERLINSGDVGQPLNVFKRPVQISLYNNAMNTIVDIDNFSLTIDASDKNLVANGDFTHGMDFWYFSTDNHLPWHIKNLPVHLLFDQGGLGALLFSLLFTTAILNCCRRLPKQPVFSAILLTSFSGFMVVGFVDSPFDAPRLTLLFFLQLFFALMRTPRSWSTT